ncbi:hypothetical protein [Parasphingorhabdus pacifica]
MDPSDTSVTPPQQQLTPATPPLPVQDRKTRAPQPVELEDPEESHLVRGYD